MYNDRSLTFGFALLILLIAISPVLAISPGWLGPQLVTLVVAATLMLSPSAPENDIRGCLAIFKPLVPALLFPVVWMLLQLAPVPLGSIDHPVWRSAAAALSQPPSGHISIDLGFTLRSLIGYLSLLSLTLLTSVLTRHRDRAETVLFALCTITIFMALELLLFCALAGGKPEHNSNRFIDSLVALSAFGVILNVTLVVRTVERYETRREPHSLSWKAFAWTLLFGAAGTAVCLFALLISTTYDVLIAAAFGLMVLFLVILIRRLGLTRWTAVTVCAAGFIVCGGVIALRFAANPTASSLFRFTQLDAADAGAATLRMLSDANWAGSGVGSYEALASIYSDGSPGPDLGRINTITSMLLEWGVLGVIIEIVLLIQLFVVLFRGALLRGRDSFYAASAAACLVVAFCQAYCDASLVDVTVQMLAAVILGVGLSQTTGYRAT